MQPKTIIERLIERIEALEAYIKILGDVEELIDRIDALEENIYVTKRVLTFAEAADYLGVSHSHLYKLTALQEIPHFKPRGKLIYFERQELEQWLLEQKVPTVQEQIQVAQEAKKKEKAAKESKGNRFMRHKKARGGTTDKH